jgi:hypothetical protein
MFQRVRTAGWVLPGNLPKIHTQDLSSFLYASKRCSSRFNHRLCLLVLGLPRISIVRHNLNRHHRCLTARPSPMQEPQRQQSNWPLLQFKNDRTLYIIAFWILSNSAPGWYLHSGQGGQQRCIPMNGLHSTSSAALYSLHLTMEPCSSLALTVLDVSWNV